jgi:hypothetical protein
MDPRIIGLEQWDQINRALINWYLFVALAANTAVAFLVAHAVIPSLLLTDDAPRDVRPLRWVFYPISAVSIVLMFYMLFRALSLAVYALQDIYPRFAI